MRDEYLKEYLKALADDGRVAVGDGAVAYWTSCGRHYRGVGTVSKVSAKSLRVRLAEAVGPYPVGFEVRVPRACDLFGWTWANRAGILGPAPAPAGAEGVAHA